MDEVRQLRQEALAWRNRFVRLLDRSPSPIAISDGDGELTAVNLAFAAVWGTRPSRMNGRNLLDLFTPTDRDSLRRAVDALKHGRRSRYPLTVRWQVRGQTHTGELTVEPVNDELIDPPPLLASLRVDPPADAAPALPEVPEIQARILAQAAAGATTATIARAVGLTADGVNYHLARLSTRLDAPNRTALVARAYVVGLLDPTAWPPKPRHSPRSS